MTPLPALREAVAVPDIPGPRRPLCWKQDPDTMARCDRARHGPDVRHTWEIAADLAAARAVLETAYKAGHLRGNRHIVSMAGQSEREYDWLAWQARSKKENP